MQEVHVNFEAMFTPFRIVLALTQKKPYLKGLLFTHENVLCGDAITVTEQSCAASITKMKSHLSDKGDLCATTKTYHHRGGGPSLMGYVF